VGDVAQSEQEVLTERLSRYPADRYPVQHATTQFHLGSVLLHVGQTVPALVALTAAQQVFDGAGMALERAKASLMLGVALRSAGERQQAAAAFTAAGTELEGLGQPAEQGAAAYNLGLVLQDEGDLDGAYAAWTTAREAFIRAKYPAQAAAAARDHGAALLTAGQVDEAVTLLKQAVGLADQARDSQSAGTAGNALGLALLAAEDADGAVGTLRQALAAFPRAVKPAEHAMVKANLALAYEHSEQSARARLAAAQALAVPGAAAPVRAQAQQLLGRLGEVFADDLMSVLDGEPDQDKWVLIVREELLRAVELPVAGRTAVLSGFLDGLLTRPAESYAMAESLLNVILELPPRTYDQLIAAFIAACVGRPEEDLDRLRSVTGGALARFAIPQWQRLAASLNAAAEKAGQPATWR
jgi:tetratricopeptide (TPR) repeat protein